MHKEGGVKVSGSWDSSIKMRIIQDEFGQSYMPIPIWSSLPLNPVNGLEGYYQNKKVVYLNGWKDAVTMVNMLFIFSDSLLAHLADR